MGKIQRRCDIFKRDLSPAQVLIAGFASIIFIGALLLSTPFVSKNNESLSFLDALFTATSAVCVTGLTVVDTGSYFNTLGQTIIILLIQVGGLGFMTVTSILTIFMGKKFSLKNRLLMQESLNAFSLSGVIRLTKQIIFITFGIEFLGALILSTQFIPEYGYERGIFLSVFHSISAFCNAGFDALGNQNSIMAYSNNSVIMLTLIALLTLGGMGFIVILELSKNRDFKRFSLHTKLVLVTNAILLIAGFVILGSLEWNNPHTLGNMNVAQKILNALFLSATPRTAGFAAIDYNAIRDSSALFTMILMFIGGSSGSCAGGIKTTTAAILFLNVRSTARGKSNPEAFYRSIGSETVSRANAVFSVALVIVFSFTMILFITEEGKSLINIMFEVFSAYGTAGLSMSFSSKLSEIGKIVISMAMFMGRLGGLTVVLAVAQNQKKNVGNIKYPLDKVMVG